MQAVRIDVHVLTLWRQYLDGALVGPTPVTMRRIAAKKYELVLKRPGFQEIRESIRVRAARINSFIYEPKRQ